MNQVAFTMGLHEIATAVSGESSGADITVRGVSTDTRTIQPGNIFIALRGPNFDGHDYAGVAMNAGASALLLERHLELDCPQVIVSDTRIALGRLACTWRKNFDIPLLAVTGSNGKTTVKEMLTSILSVEHAVLATQGNLNNDIGVPLTLLRIDAHHQYAVIEMGANHPGEIAYLTALANPDVAVVTNAGPAHLEGFGSLAGVARAKGEIYGGLRATGTAVINADDEFSSFWLDLCRVPEILTFGLKHKADVSASWSVSKTGSHIKLSTPNGSVDIHLCLLGEHNVMNALAAVAGTLALGIDLASIKQGLENLAPVKGRLQIKAARDGGRIIDDTYNANPASLHAALHVLGQCAGKHYVALGDMGELGQNAEQLHHEAGLQARETGVSKLFTLGKLARHAALSFGEQARSFFDQPEMITAISQEMEPDVTLLVKGSRLMQMEKVVNALSQNGENH